MTNIATNGFLYNVLFIFFLYIYINNPLLQLTNGIGSIKLLYPIALIYILKNLRQSIYFFKLIDKEIIVFICLFFYTLFRTAFGGDDAAIRVFAVAFYENIFISVFLMVFLINLKKNDWLNSIIITGIVGALISVFSLLNPSINLFIKDIQVLSEFSMENDFRSFGLAEGLTFSYGISQAIILCLLIINSKKRMLFLLFTPLFIVSSLFNARTGIIIVVLILVYAIIAFRRIKLLIFLIALLFVISILSDQLIILLDNDKSFDWINNFYLEIGDLFTGSTNADYNTTQTLFVDMVVLPSNTIEWIFGSGQSLFLSYSNSTDVGFFLQLNYGGLVFTGMLLILVLMIFFKTFKEKESRWFSVLFLISFFIANMKGDFIPSTGAFRLLFFVYLCLLYYNKKTMFVETNKIVK